jgi:hypothetical protein
MSATPPRLVLGQCVRCGGGQKLVGPLHLEKGGPIVCLPYGTEWHAQQARERKQRERFIQGFGLGPSHAEPHELTLELLEEAIRLTHPDRHLDRIEQATRVTAELLALKPFVKPKPPPPPPSNASVTATPWPHRPSVTTTPRPSAEQLFKSIRPCEICRDTVPFYYCDGCKDHWETQQRKKREWVNAQQRARRALNRWYLAQRPPGRCAVCGTAFNKGKRKDARYCSGACRQRANRSRHGVPEARASEVTQGFLCAGMAPQQEGLMP